MSRYFIDDTSGKDIRSLLNTAKFAELMSSVPVSSKDRTYISTNAQSGTFNLRINSGVIFRVGPAVCHTESSVDLSSSNLHTSAGTEFVNGHDYAIFAYLTQDAMANGLNEKYYICDCGVALPTELNSNNSLCLGGFHYGYSASYDAHYNITNSDPHLGVLEFSIWTVLHRVDYDATQPDDYWLNNRGLVYIPPINKWVGIYKGFDTSHQYPKFGIEPTLVNTIPSDSKPYNELIKLFVNGNARRRWRPCTIIEYQWCGYGSPAIVGDDNNTSWIASANTKPHTNGAMKKAVSLYGCKDILGNCYEAFYDPPAVIDSVLTSSTTYNSGGNHKVCETCSHTTANFSFRVCAENCY